MNSRQYGHQPARGLRDAPEVEYELAAAAGNQVLKLSLNCVKFPRIEQIGA
jgi:hypothetical protein